MLSKVLSEHLFSGYARLNYDNHSNNNKYIPLQCKHIMNCFAGPIYYEHLTKCPDNIAHPTLHFGSISSRYIGKVCTQNAITHLQSNGKVLNNIECIKYTCYKCNNPYNKGSHFPVCNAFCHQCDSYQKDENKYVPMRQWDFSIAKSLKIHPGGIKFMISTPIDEIICKPLDYDDDENAPIQQLPIKLSNSNKYNNTNSNKYNNTIMVQSCAVINTQSNKQYGVDSVYMSYGFVFIDNGIYILQESSKYNDEANNLDNEYQSHFKKINEYDPKYNGVRFRLQHDKFVGMITTIGPDGYQNTIQEVIWPKFPFGSYRINLEVPDNNRVDLVSFKQVE